MRSLPRLALLAAALLPTLASAAATTAALHPSIQHDSFGAALQAGVDVALTDGWLFNVDVKKVRISTDVSSSGTKVGTFKVDPWLLSAGIGKRF